MSTCSYFPICTACTDWTTSYAQQIDHKIHHLKSLFAQNKINYNDPIDFISCGEKELRHRVDFTLIFNTQTGSHDFGFYDVNKKLVPISKCLQLAPELQAVYSEFIKFKFTYKDSFIQKGSVRLRVGPTGLKGCWLDFSNNDIKNLLEDGVLLKQIQAAGFWIEIGQKGKHLEVIDSKFKLGEPTSQIWFKTFDHKGQDILLRGLISDFTQPSWISAKTLVQISLNWLVPLKFVSSIIEFGAGLGQFTLSFLKENMYVYAFEVNSSASAQLQENAKLYQLEKKIQIEIGDFHKKSMKILPQAQLAFVNPARSGLKNFCDELLKQQTEYIIYISCFPESLCEDIHKLSILYKITDVKIVDQFPQTKHYETCVFLKKIT